MADLRAHAALLPPDLPTTAPATAATHTFLLHGLSKTTLTIVL